MIPDVGTSA